MSQLSGQQVAQLAYGVGVRGTNLITSVAIAWAESGLRTDALGWNFDPVTGERTSRDRGLWQINDYWHPDVTDACAFDPACNAGAMFRISNRGTNWNPWSTFTNGAYRQYIASASIAVSAMQAQGGTQPVANPQEAMLAWIRAGGNPIQATVALLQGLIDAAVDAKFGPGHRTGPILGGIKLWK